MSGRSKRNKGGASSKIDPVGASKKDDDALAHQTSTPSRGQEVAWHLIISLVLLGVLAGFFAGCLFGLYVVRPAWTEMVPKWRLDFKCSVIHILGDSTVAAGNFEMTSLPYGVDFNGSKPSGRFSNGYTIGDYSAIENHSPIPQAYRSLGEERKSDFGINFASAGCGIMDATRPPSRSFTCASMSEQMKQLLSLDLDLSESVVFISLGGNDYMFSFNGKAAEDPKGFAKELVRQLMRNLMSLYTRGVRKFLINNIGPVGCIPNKRNRTSTCDKDLNKAIPNKRNRTSTCDKDLNKAIAVYNALLHIELKELPKEASIVMANSHELFTGIFKDPAKYGFNVTEDHCCGTWDADHNMYSCNEESGYCDDREHILFFDGAHTTDKANKVFAHECFAGRICHQIL